MLTEQARARIVAEQTASFLADGFSQLDLSGSPDLLPLEDHPFSEFDKHGLNNVQVPGSNGLKEFANNPDSETLNRLSIETGDPDLAEHVRDDQEGTVAEEFVRTHKGYYCTDDNYTLIREYMDEKHLAFTADNLHAAFTALSKSGQLEMKPGTAKSLSESQQLHVISLVKAGQLDDGLSTYLSYSLPDANEQWSNMTEFFSDPATLSVRNNAVFFCWYHSRPVQFSAEFDTFQQQYFRMRPIITLSDLDSCYDAFQANERSVLRDQMIHDTQPQTRQDLDDLSDDAVGRLTEATRKMRARQMLKARRGA
jgi:hypothetical protein